MQNKALIFGINGQDGFYLTKLLEQNQISVIGVSRTNAELEGNVGNYDFVESIIKNHQPDYIFHLAANSTTQHAVLFENHETISTGTLNILESVKLYCPEAVVFLSGSAMQFKNVGKPINEQTPFDASSAYSVSRIQSIYAGRYYREKFGLKVYMGYFFNHDSPLRTEKHVNQKIVRAVQRIDKGSSEKLELGNIDVQKEFNFAGDVVEAIWKLVNQEIVFEAVIGSGITFSIKDWITYCFEKINRNWKESVFQKDFYIPEYQTLISDPTLIKSLGWSPKINFYQLADMMMANF
jgi:GDPmannose 4,6-dehydratase